VSTDNILAPIAALSLPDSATLSGRAQQALGFIQSMTIASAEDYGFAADELMAIKTKANALEKQRTAITGPMNTALKGINDLFRGPAELLAQGERMLKSKMLAWDQEQERLARIERERAEAAAAAERKRLEDEAAARQAEADAQAEAARKAAAAGDEQAAAVAQANADRANSQAQEAAITSQLVVAAPAVVEVAKVKGVSTSKKVDFEVVDLHALVKHVAARPELLALVIADSVKLRAYVKGLGMACQLPGVRVFEERVLSARAA
jgi:DNA polymerase III gamma/tau subunit